MDDAMQNKVVLGCSAFAPGPAGSPVSPGVLQPHSCPIPVVPHPGKAPAVPARSEMGKGGRNHGRAWGSRNGCGGCQCSWCHWLRWSCAGRAVQRPPERGAAEPTGETLQGEGRTGNDAPGHACVRACACTPAVGAQGLPGRSRAPWGSAGPGSPLTHRDSLLVKSFLASLIPNFLHFFLPFPDTRGLQAVAKPSLGHGPSTHFPAPAHPSANHFTIYLVKDNRTAMPCSHRPQQQAVVLRIPPSF